MKPKIYIAAPLFSAAEKNFNKQLKAELSKWYEIYLPQDDGMLIVDLIKTGVSFESASKMVFDADINAIDESDVLLMILDGRTVDEGASVELGYAYSKHKLCVGLSTDPRSLLTYGHNPMITGCLATTVHSVEEFNNYMFNKLGVAVKYASCSHFMCI